MLATAAGTGRNAVAEIVRRPVLTPDIAWAMLEGCRAYAQQNRWHVSIAVVDPGAALMAFFRMDGTSLNSINSAEQKARTSATIGLPTGDLADRSGSKGGAEAPLLAAQQLAMGFYAAQGGLPIKVEGTLIGAIAASGESPENDEKCARAGMEAGLKRMGAM
jgi:uncharacterized protein GlcG (DUF336 family)